jgi:hypothetical protein
MIKQYCLKLLTLLLIFIGQVQPLQVHALVLEAEQAGHIAGFLQHSHTDEIDNHSSDHQNLNTATEHGTHQSECHPAHITLLPEGSPDRLTRIPPSWELANKLDWPSATLKQATPPPKA